MRRNETDNDKGAAAIPVSNPRLTPQLRRFVELHLGGKTKVDAWAESTGKPKVRGTSGAASRAWKGRAVQDYLAELEGRKAAGETAPGGQGAITLSASELQRRADLLGAAKLSRDSIMTWLLGVLMVGADELLDGAGDVKPEFRPLVQSYERIPGPLGERIKVTMPNKLTALRMLAEMHGWLKPENGAENNAFLAYLAEVYAAAGKQQAGGSN